MLEAVIGRGSNDEKEDTREYTTDHRSNVHTTRANVISSHRTEREDIGAYSLTPEEEVGELLVGGEEEDLTCHQKMQNDASKMLTQIRLGLWLGSRR